MDYKRVLTVQDISCFGQCSLTVALPIISACGVETSVIPSSILSTHTAGFTGFTFRDLAGDIPAIGAHWKKEKITFDAFYTGYLGSPEQVDYLLDIFASCAAPGAEKIIDPAMADYGKLYPIFDDVYVEAMKRLCAAADLTLPNITEACFLTGIEYKTEYDEAYIKSLVDGLCDLGAKKVVLTGVGYEPAYTGVVVGNKDGLRYYRHERLERSSHGTGDVYAASFVGAYMRGKDAFDAAKIAADYTVKCIKNTVDDESHWYGVKFEPVLPELIKEL